MKRLLLVASLAAAFAGPAFAGPPQVGDPGGYCDGDIDVVCREYPCQPDLPCSIEYCGIWRDGECWRG